MLDQPTVPTKLHFATDNGRPAVEALAHAQFIAFAPYVFQASVLLRDRGILAEINKHNRSGGASLDALLVATGMSKYAVRVLLEAGLGIGLVLEREGSYFISKVGHFFLNDEMTRVNTNFMRDVCYAGVRDLEASLDENRPAGLRHLNPDWATIYPHISSLDPQTKQSWFEFDHYYSDNAFPVALPIVFADKPRHILDIGGNTGKFILQCLQYDPQVHMGMADLPEQIATASERIAAEGLSERVSYHPCNLLTEDSSLPSGYDLIWMSQFLDCFSDLEILSILRKCCDALPVGGRVMILETFWDRQKFAASAFSLQMISLYFTTMANGNSQMYDSRVFMQIIEDAGFRISEVRDDIGKGHTLLMLEKASL